MTPASRTETVWSIDDLELELRKLPGVRAAGFDDVDDMLMVQLHVADTGERIPRSERGDQPVPVSASRIAARHSDRPVAVEIVRWRSTLLGSPTLLAPEPSTAIAADEAPESSAASTVLATPEPGASDVGARRGRARLLAVLAFPETDEIEVHLVLGERRSIGRAPASAGIEGTVVATIDAVHDLGVRITPQLEWARTLGETNAEPVVVAVALRGVDDRSPVHYGVAPGLSLIDAAARATLDALNRVAGR